MSMMMDKPTVVPELKQDISYGCNKLASSICKILTVSTKDQVLHAVKNLMVCSACIWARAELQNQEEGDGLLTDLKDEINLELGNRIRVVDKDSKTRTNNFSIKPVAGKAMTQLFATDSREELCKRMEAFWQHFHDLRKKLRKNGSEFLLGQQKESASSLRALLLNGSHKLVVQKNVHPGAGKEDMSPNDGHGKKRSAPPSIHKSPYSVQTQVKESLGKENWEKSGSTCESSPFERPIAAPHKLPPCRKSSLTVHGNTLSLVIKTESETTSPRQKSIKEMLNPRSWLQPQK
ncbi:LOW QUALITY PROTEIN: rhotekin-2 [Eudromia elegans]